MENRLYFLSPIHFSELIAPPRNRMGNLFAVREYWATVLHEHRQQPRLEKFKIFVASRCASSHKPHPSHTCRFACNVRHNCARVHVCFVHYMACGRIDIRARVNYFSRNSESRYRLRNPCATGYASKVNIMHFSSPTPSPPSSPPPPSFSLPLSLFFSALAIFERDKGRICREAKLDKTLRPPFPPRATPRRAFRML